MKEIYYKLINWMYPQMIQPIVIEEPKEPSVLSKILDGLLSELKGA